MYPKVTPKDEQKKSPVNVLELIENAKNAEVCMDLKTLREILLPVWPDDNRIPSFEEYNHAVSAELLRLCGFYLSTFGLASQKQDYQERGKNCLTTAIDLFELAGLREKAAESYVILADCYWKAGEAREFEDTLKLVEAEYIQDSFDPVYLKIRINKLTVMCWNDELDQAANLIKEISPAMEFCPNVRLKAMFHNAAGMIYKNKKLKDHAIVHYRQSMRYSRESNNLRFIAIVWNNLAGLYSNSQEFDLAHQSVSEAIKILTGLDDFWLLPHTIDTKANIYFSAGKYVEALETIAWAIDIFERSEDARGLVETLWTKTKCLLRLNRKEEALHIFSQLMQVARERVGEKTAEKFAKALSDEIYVIKDLPLLEEVSRFKKTLVLKALRSAQGVIGKAANILKLKNHKTLSQILDKQFPELRHELGLDRRAIRSDSKQKQAFKEDIKNEVKEILNREIERVVMPEKNYSFDFNFHSETFLTFIFKKTQMRKFGVDKDSVVAVFPFRELQIGSLVIISTGDDHLAGKIEYDVQDKVYFIRDEIGFPVPIDESNIVGEPMGHCPKSKIGDTFIRFSKLTI